jgi:hypothetical protein
MTIQIVIYIIIDEMSMINYLLPIMLQAILPLFLLATVPVRVTRNLPPPRVDKLTAIPHSSSSALRVPDGLLPKGDSTRRQLSWIPCDPRRPTLTSNI